MASVADEKSKLAEARAAVGDDYVPDDSEEYMNEKQQDYFRMLLLDWKKSIHGIELRTRDRQRKLISKIDSALRRIDEGEYGWCEVTGDPIGLKRLIARPVATMTVEAQEAHERREKISRDD